MMEMLRLDEVDPIKEIAALGRSSSPSPDKNLTSFTLAYFTFTGTRSMSSARTRCGLLYKLLYLRPNSSSLLFFTQHSKF